MDKLDKKILEQLILNSRISVKRLAKNIESSREVVNYRINNLNKELIKKYTTQINYKRLGYKKHTCFIKFKGISLKEEEEIIKFLTNHELIMYLSPIIGKWNIAFDILAKDDAKLKNILDNINNFYSKYLDKCIVIGTGIEEYTFPTKYIEIVNTQKNKKHKIDHGIDKIDKKILGLLSNNSRLSYIEISKKINLNPNTIKYRIKKLEESKIILGYTLFIDFKKLDYELYNLQLSYNKNNEKLKSFFQRHPKVVYYYRYLGNENWDIDIGLIVKNSSELRNFIIEIRKVFPEITIFDIYILTKILKDHAPKGIFKD